ncbi:unnamed protein product, partial [Musa acuminata subsp. burmannicoides]
DIVEILLPTKKSITTTSSTIRTYDSRTKQIPIGSSWLQPHLPSRVLVIHDGESRAVIGVTDMLQRLQQDALRLAGKALVDLFDIT